MEPFGELICGYYDSSAYTGREYSVEHTVRRYEIEYYLEDASVTYCDGAEFPVLRDHILIARPGQRRYSRLPFKTLYVKFSCTEELAARLSAAPQYFRAVRTGEIRTVLQELSLLCERQDADELLLQSRMLYLVYLILRDAAAPPTVSAGDGETVDSAKRFIAAHFSEPIRLSDVAAAVHLSPTYFHHVFLSVCGETPHDYLIGCRLSHAKRLLWDPHNPVAQIAEQSGFGCQQYMNKVFRKRLGITPVQYRKQLHRQYDL